MQRIIVTSYVGPDLDGTAWAIASAEYLKSEVKDAIAAVFSTPHKEAQFVFQSFGITSPQSS